MLPAVAYDHKRADRDIFPTRGRRLTLELRGTGQFLGSTTVFCADRDQRAVRSFPV